MLFLSSYKNIMHAGLFVLIAVLIVGCANQTSFIFPIPTKNAEKKVEKHFVGMWEFIPVENKILEITLAVSYYFSRNSIEAAVYYYQEQIIKATTGNSAKFDEFYEMLSDTAFDKRNIHQLLREALIQRSDIFNSSMVFFILSSWDSEAEKLLSIFEENALFSVICFVTDDEKSIPDLSHHNRLKLMVISPYDKLMEDIG